jgi:hypothetical protein
MQRLLGDDLICAKSKSLIFSRRTAIKPLALILLLLMPVQWAMPCSMFKVTRYGKTMVGNNEDAWRRDSRIWFEAGSPGVLGAAYVGHNDGFPQGGMNEAGLVFDGFTVYDNKLRSVPGKPDIGPIGPFVKRIMQQCATVEEVRRIVSAYDNSAHPNGMWLFVDKTGKYLVVEKDTTIIGNDPTYVLANFCPSVTPAPDNLGIGRYDRGRKFLSNKSDTSLAFCIAAVDTMHECRKHLGDGTTYSSIYDLEEGKITLAFYHDYAHTVTFKLKNELQKGDHGMLMSGLFPVNQEYERFVAYKTPFTSITMRLVTLAGGLAQLLLVTGFLVLMRRNKTEPYAWLLPIASGLLLLIHFYFLQMIQQEYYFDAPYHEAGRPILNASSYIPFLMIPLTILMAYRMFKSARSPIQSPARSGPWIAQTVLCLAAISLYTYWGMYDIRG